MTSARSIEGDMPAAELWFLSHPSAGAEQGPEFNHFVIIPALTVMRIQDIGYLSGSACWSPPTAPSPASSVFGEAVSMASVFLAISLWGGARMIDRNLGVGSSSN